MVINVKSYTKIVLSIPKFSLLPHPVNTSEYLVTVHNLTMELSQYLLTHMGFVKRKASTSAKKSVENFKEKRELFIHEMELVVEMEEILAELVTNFGIKYIPN